MASLEMREILQSRVESLKKELEAGQGRLQELEREQMYVRDTLLRISGAIQVLEEVLSDGPPAASEESQGGEERQASS